VSGAGELDLAAYLRRIGFAGTPAPTRACLEQLVALHASALPFENIEVIAHRVPRLDLAGLQDKLVRRRRGGYCFEQNTLLRHVLQAIGFAVQPMEARIRSGVPADVVTARTHLATRVTLGDGHHLVDVGCGTLAPMAPLALASRDAQASGTGVHRLVEVGDELLLQQRQAAGWTDCYQLLPGVPHAIDAEMGNWFVATWPTSFLAANLLVGRAIEGGRLRLFNRTLASFQPEFAAPIERQLQSRAEFADVLADGFGLEVAPADLDAVMAALDRLPPA
jgi:N-hydroxyarylamine O-acetyltransferase